MSVSNKEFKLLITAENGAKRTFDEMKRDYADLVKFANQQVDAAKQGKISIEEMNVALRDVAKAQASIGEKSLQLKDWEAYQAKVDKVTEKLEEAKRKRDDFEANGNKYNKDGSDSKTYLNKLAGFDQQIERFNTQLTAAKDKQQQYLDLLKSTGNEIDSVFGKDSEVRDFGASMQKSLIDLDNAAKAVPAALRAIKEDEAELRDLQRQSAGEQESALRKQVELQKEVKAAKATALKDEFDSLLENERRDQNASIRKVIEQQAAIEKAAANKKAATSQADDFAERTTTLRAYGESAGLAEVKIRKMADTLNAITNPAKAARETLAGVDEQVTKFEQDIASVNGPISNLKEHLAELADIQKSLNTKGDMLDGYRQQIEKVAQLKVEYEKYMATLQKMRSEAASADAASGKLDRRFNEQEAAARNAGRAYDNAKGRLATLDAELKRAGIDTNNLAEAEQHVADTMRRAQASVTSLTQAVQQHGTAVENTNKGWSFFNNDGGRTTLSLMQRLRGEVLSVTATYVGLYGAMEGVKRIIEAGVEKQTVFNQLGVVVGTDQKLIAQEFEYVHQQAERLGISFKELSGTYSKWTVDTKFANVTAQESKFIFEGLSEAMRVNHKSSSEINEGYRQLGQMLSKGKMGMDDLRAAMNYIPGLQGMMAKGLHELGYEGISATNSLGDMYKLMESKGVDSFSAIYGAVMQMNRAYKDQLPEALRGLQAEQGRFNTKIFDFMVMVNDKGFGKAYTEFLRELTSNMDGEQAEKFAQLLSDGLTKVIDIIKLMIDNADLLGAALETALLIKGSYMVIKLAADLPRLIPVFKMLFTSIGDGATVASAKVAFLTTTFGLLSAAITGWQIGTYLRENFEEARLAGIAFVQGMVNVFRELKFSVQLTTAAIEDMFSSSANNLTKGQKYQQDMNAWRVAEPKATGSVVVDYMMEDQRKKWKASEPKMPSNPDEKVNPDSASHYDKVLGEKRKQEAADNAIFDKMVDDEIRAARKAKEPAAPTAAPPKTEQPAYAGRKWQPTASDKTAEKREKSIDSIENELASMRAQLDTAEKDNLAVRIQAYRERYQALAEKIRKVGGTEGARLQAEMDRIVGEFSKNETEKYAKEVTDQQRALVGKMDSLDTQSATKMTDVVRAKRQLIKDQYDQLFKQIDDYERKLRGQNGGKISAADQDTIAGYRTTATNARNNANSRVGDDAYRETLKRNEQQLNVLADQRQQKINDINLEVENGIITQEEGYARSRAAIDEMEPKLQQMANTMLEQAKAAGATDEQLQAMQAHFTSIINKTDNVRTGIYTMKDAMADTSALTVDMFKGFASGLVNVEKGTSRWKSALKGVEQAFLSFAANFLMKIAEMILQQQVLNAMQAAGFGASNGATALFHTGGIVGSSGGMSRNANPGWFANAPKYHTGGIVGLQADEYPAILKKNEEVLTADSPRNALNGAGSGKNVTVKGGDTKIINAIDSDSVVQAGLNSTSGTKTLVNWIRANKTQVKTIIGS